MLLQKREDFSCQTFYILGLQCIFPLEYGLSWCLAMNQMQQCCIFGTVFTLQSMGLDFTEDEIQMLVQDLDEDNDGQINYR